MKTLLHLSVATFCIACSFVGSFNIASWFCIFGAAANLLHVFMDLQEKHQWKLKPGKKKHCG